MRTRASSATRRNLTPKQILAAFVASRAHHWHAVNNPEREFEDLLLAVNLDPLCPAYRGNLVVCWQKVKPLIERDFAKIAGEEALLADKGERARREAHEKAIAEAEAQVARMKGQSGIPDVNRIKNSPMYTGTGWEYNPRMQQETRR